MKKKNYPMWQDDEEMEYMNEMDDEEMAMKKTMMPQSGMPMMLAHAYVPWQFYDKAFCPQDALMQGTLFPELWGAYPIPD
ncbi:hypothetical protein SDC9_163352 [bioreactor metagenome]|uniref:Spore coat associated protein JA (CotJA) n=1 Tax=bioreactor metagenome TaxID=1076179 RepID=A0A645FVF5_9ZZZZ